jgi:hypothetical protein
METANIGDSPFDKTKDMSPRIARIEFVIGTNFHGINKSVQSAAKLSCERDDHPNIPLIFKL